MGGSGPSSAARLSRTRGCDAPPWQGRSAADPGPGRGKSGHGRTSLSLTTTLINCIFEPGCVISTPRRNVRPRAAIVPPSRADAPEAPGTAVSWSCTMREADSRGMRKLVLYALLGVLGLAIAGLLRQRQRPIPIPPPLTFLFENPLVEAFAGSELLVKRLDLAPGMRVLDAGCGPGRLTIPVARAVEPTGEVVALDSQRAMLEKLEHRLEAESITNVRTLEAGLGEVRDREAAGRELFAALKPGGILSVTEGFGDPDYRRPTSVRREVESAGFELVERFGGFPVYTLNFRRPEYLST